MKFLGENSATLKFIDCCLRLFVIPLGVLSLFLTLNNHQDNSIYGKLEFSNIKGFKYIVCISAISAGYALVAVVFSWVRFLATKAWFFFLFDQFVAYVLITSVAAIEEMVYLTYYGDKLVSWSEACSSYGRFCGKMKMILALNALAFSCFFTLAVISAYGVFSGYEPPLMPSKEPGEERT